MVTEGTLCPPASIVTNLVSLIRMIGGAGNCANQLFTACSTPASLTPRKSLNLIPNVLDLVELTGSAFVVPLVTIVLRNWSRRAPFRFSRRGKIAPRLSNEHAQSQYGVQSPVNSSLPSLSRPSWPCHRPKRPYHGRPSSRLTSVLDHRQCSMRVSERIFLRSLGGHLDVQLDRRVGSAAGRIFCR
jgi:hypothetical protein